MRLNMIKIAAFILCILLSSCASFAPSIYRENKENKALAKSLAGKTVREMLKTLNLEPVDSEHFFIYFEPPCAVNSVMIKTETKYIYLKVDAPNKDWLESCKYKSVDFLDTKPRTIIVWKEFMVW